MESKTQYIKKSDLLLELWSHSDEIDGYVKDIYDTIREDAKQRGWKTIIPDRLFVKKGTAPIRLFDRDVLLHYTLFMAMDEETAMMVINEMPNENGVDRYGQQLTLTIPTLKGNVIERYCNNNIYHELEHLLQISKKIKNAAKRPSLTDGAYTIAANIVTNAVNVSETEKNIAWLYYYSDRSEQDAFVNEYYSDLMALRQFIIDNDSVTRARLRDYENKARWYFDNKDNPEVVAAVNMYRGEGMSKRNFETMVTKGLKRFKRKMLNVEKHFQDVVRNLKENHICTNDNRTCTGSLIWIF